LQIIRAVRESDKKNAAVQVAVEQFHSPKFLFLKDKKHPTSDKPWVGLKIDHNCPYENGSLWLSAVFRQAHIVQNHLLPPKPVPNVDLPAGSPMITGATI